MKPVAAPPHVTPRVVAAVSLRTFAFMLVVAACSVWLAAASYKFISTWKAPDGTPLNFAGKKVVALAITSDDNLRMSAEQALAREITARGPRGVAAYTVIPREVLKDKDKARSWFERTKVDGVVALRIVSQEKVATYSALVWSSGYYGNFWDYYGNGWTTVYPIGQARMDTVLAVETMLYRVSDAKLLWAGVSETTNPKDVGTFMKGLASEVVKELRKEGLVGKDAK